MCKVIESLSQRTFGKQFLGSVAVRRTGFDLFNHWRKLYDAASTGGRVPVSNMVVSVNAKLRFNACLERIKGTYGINSEEAQYTMFFMYLHNPLALKHPKEYGNLVNFERSIAHFRYWQCNNTDLISEIGVTAAIIRTKPQLESVDLFLQDYLVEMVDSLSKK
jgi:hypothetical protein